MNVMSTDNEILGAKARDRWEDDGGSAWPDPIAGPPPGSPVSSAPETLPFPRLDAGKTVLEDLELVRLVSTGTFGKYRVQQAGLGERGAVFVVSLFGATCSKVEMRIGRKLDWHDYVAAMKRAIERELGYWQNRGEAFLPGVPRAIEVTVRDTDFALP